MGEAVRIERLDAEAVGRWAGELGRVLRRCVEAGASVGFVTPFEQAAAERYWREAVAPAAAAGGVAALGAFVGETLAGTAQLALMAQANQPHRAEVAKVLVDPAFRRRGVARALMAGLEQEARAAGRWLLTLDTASPDKAEPLYASLGYQRAGAIPHFALDPIEDRYDATVFMWKRL